MDPLSAIGLASSLIQFIDFGFKVYKRLDEFNTSNHEVPRSLQAIHIQLPLLLNSLGKINSEAHLKTLDLDTKCILRGIVAGCMNQVTEVEAMINEISGAPGESLSVKMKKAFLSLKHDEKIWTIERNLQTYIAVLILHHVVDAKDALPPPSDDTYFDVREKMVSPFVERPNLIQQLDEHLRKASRSQTTNPIIISLAGNKDAGKTQLALSYCYEAHALNQFRSVFWIDASTLENLYLGFESIYATIKRSTTGSRAEKLAFVTSFLNDLWHPWLLVLDNYRPDLMYNHIMDVLPSRGYGGIILITRGDANDGLGEIIRVPKFLTVDEQRGLNSVLTQAVQSKNEDGIRKAVEQGADVNTLIWDQWPVLHRCALFGLLDSVSLLLDQGAIPNPPNAGVRKPLYWAASGSHSKVASLLLDHEDEIGLYSNSAELQAVFNEAGEKGDLEIMQMMRKRRGVDLNSKNQYDATPLESAAKKGHFEILRFLIDEGALVENQVQAELALVAAASAGHLDIVKLLCEEGKVSPNLSGGGAESPLSSAAASRDSSNKENGFEMAKYLISHGADPNPIGVSNGPLHQAALYDHVKTVELLLEHGADPTMLINGWCPLTNAIRYESPGAITALLKARVKDSAAQKAWLERALRFASRTGADREIVLKILEAGADINAVEETGSPKGASPLLLSILNDHVKVAQLLIRRGAKQDAVDEIGRMALPLAAESGYETLVRDLIRAGGKADMKSGPNEDTPLILAAGRGHEKVVKVLLDNAADKELANKFGDIALDVAEEKGHKETIKLLE